jgi:transposase
MTFIAMPFVKTATRRAVTGAHADDRRLPDSPRQARRYAGVTPRRRGTS